MLQLTIIIHCHSSLPLWCGYLLLFDFVLYAVALPLPPLDNIRVMVIIWRLRRNTCIIRTALCWIVWHSVHSPQHTYMTSSYKSNRMGLSHWDPYTVYKGSCLQLYYCNMVEWFWWDSNLILTTNWFPSVLWHRWFGHLASKCCPWNDLWCAEWDAKHIHYDYYYYYFLRSRCCCLLWSFVCISL